MANTLKTLTELQGDFIARKLMLMEARLKAVEDTIVILDECRKKMCGEDKPEEPNPDIPTTNPPQTGFWIAFPKSASSIVLPETSTTMYSLAMRITDANGNTYSELDHSLRLSVGETYCWDDVNYYYSCYTGFGNGAQKFDNVLLNSGYLYEIVVKSSSNGTCYTGLYVTGDELIEAKSNGVSVVYAHEKPIVQPSSNEENNGNNNNENNGESNQEEEPIQEEQEITATHERFISYEFLAQYERLISPQFNGEYSRFIEVETL
ncbi:MAG: hypothetical protein IKR17_04785 [Bacteroidales bacterium]|nr:hypothetical protein [Bacteroidales bacterium]